MSARELRDAMDAPTAADQGFTLVEILVVVMVLALISTALTTTIVTLLRTTPRITAMVDDSRGALQMLSSIERDVGATPPSGVDITPGATGCSTTDPGKNVLQLTWNDGTIVRRAAYRLVTTPAETWIERRSCSGDAVNRLVTARRSRVARELIAPPSTWAGGAPPARVTVANNVVTVVLTQTSGVTTFSARLQTALSVLP